HHVLWRHEVTATAAPWSCVASWPVPGARRPRPRSGPLCTTLARGPRVRSGVLLLGDTVMIPDFALTHQRLGQRVLIEIVGFWHPDYLRRKVEKVRAAHCHHLLLLVYEGVNLAAERLRDVPGEVVSFKHKPVL